MRLHFPSIALSLSLLFVPAAASADRVAQFEDEDEDFGAEEPADDFGDFDSAPAEAAPAAELEAGAAAAAGPGVGPFTKENYPTSLLLRPLTLPAGTIQATPEFAHFKIDFGFGSASATGLFVTGAYGITDQIQVALGTGILVDPEFEWSESLGIAAAFLAHDTEMIDVAATLATSLNFGSGQDIVSGVTLGADSRIVVHDIVFLRAGQSLVDILFDPFFLDLDINVGVGIQATPQLAFVLDTQLVSIGVAGDGNSTTHLGDFIPVSLTGFFGINHQIDAFLNLVFPSIEDAGDLYLIQAGANIRL
jgi:hypothetical protein